MMKNIAISAWYHPLRIQLKTINVRTMAEITSGKIKKSPTIYFLFQMSNFLSQLVVNKCIQNILDLAYAISKFSEDIVEITVPDLFILILLKSKQHWFCPHSTFYEQISMQKNFKPNDYHLFFSKYK